MGGSGRHGQTPQKSTPIQLRRPREGMVTLHWDVHQMGRAGCGHLPSVLAVLGEVPLGGEARGRGPASISTSGT